MHNITTIMLVRELKRLGRKTNRQATYLADLIETEIKTRAIRAMEEVGL